MPRTALLVQRCTASDAECVLVSSSAVSVEADTAGLPSAAPHLVVRGHGGRRAGGGSGGGGGSRVEALDFEGSPEQWPEES